MKKIIPFLMAGIFTDTAAHESSFSFSLPAYSKISGKEEGQTLLPTQLFIPATLIYDQGAKSAEDFCQRTLEQISHGQLADSWNKLSQAIRLEIIFYKIVQWATHNIDYSSCNNNLYFPTLSSESMENFYSPLIKLLSKGFRKGHGSRSIFAHQCYLVVTTSDFKEPQPRVHFSIHTKENDGSPRALYNIKENLSLSRQRKFNRDLKRLSTKRLVKFGIPAPLLEHIHTEMDYLWDLYFFIKVVHHNGYQSPLDHPRLDHPHTTVNNELTTAQQVLLDTSFKLSKSQIRTWEPIFHRISDWANNRLASQAILDPTTEKYLDEMDKLLKLYTFIIGRGTEMLKVPTCSTLYSTIFSEMKAWESLFDQAIVSLEKEHIFYNRPHFTFNKLAVSYDEVLTTEMYHIQAQHYYPSPRPSLIISPQVRLSSPLKEDVNPGETKINLFRDNFLTTGLSQAASHGSLTRN